MDRVTEDRYSRQIRFSPIGPNGQERLRSSRVAIIGLGALGTVIANHLARAGVGYLRLIDRDFVEISNLTRQMLFDENDVALSKPKVVAAADKLQAINAEVDIDPHIAHLDERNAEELLCDVDLILDGTDNLTTRFIINDVSHKLCVPWIYGAAIHSRGVIVPILPRETHCLRCIIPTLPKTDRLENCDTVGVVGPAVNIVASYQTTEAIKWLIGAHQSINRNMLQLDVWHNQFISIDLSTAKKEDCPCCALQHYHYLHRKLEYTRIQTICGRRSIQFQPHNPTLISLEEWEIRLQKHGIVERTPFLLKLMITVRLKLILFPDGRTIIQGTDDIETAEKMYRYYLNMY